MRPESAHRCWPRRAGRNCWNTSGSAHRSRAGSSPRSTSPHWSATPSWSSSSRPPENHHHAYPGGMLDHGLEIVAYALKLRQSYLLPAGVTPEAQAAQAEAWTAGTAYAACCTTSARLRSICTSSMPTAASGILARPAAKALPLPLPKDANTACTAPPPGCSTRASRSGHLRLAQRLSRPLGRAAVRAGRPVRARRHARRTGRAGRPGIGRPGTRRRSQQGAGGAPACAATQIARRLALPAQGRVQVEPGRPGGRLADPGRLVAGEQDRLRQAARTSAVAGHRRHPGQQYGGVQRAAGSRHRATDAGWQGDLEGYRHQRRRLVARLHLPETRRR